MVVTALRAGDRDFLNVRDVRPQEADLGVGVGRAGFGRRRDVDVGAGQRGGVFERGRQAWGRDAAGGRRARARKVEAGRAHHDRRHGPGEKDDGQDDQARASHERRAAAVSMSTTEAASGRP